MILFDGDIIVYRAGFAADADPFYMLARLHRAKMLVELMIRRAQDKIGDHQYQIYLTNGDLKCNNRYHIAKTKGYKANRKGEKPTTYHDLRRWMVEKLGAIVVTGIEADDALGMRAHEEGVTIASIDKDLMTVPGRHYNLETAEIVQVTNPGKLLLQIRHVPEYVSKKTGKIVRAHDVKTLKGYGFKFYCAQMLMGDEADNIPGLRLYGDVKAFTKLEKCATIRGMWAQVLREYRKMKAMDRLEEIKQLLWIQQQYTFEELVYVK